ncbi:flippase [Candidatus Bipolaricaulota bacterium]|nr:flippase [Candidatus Bipolaricaulota bacterium]
MTENKKEREEGIKQLAGQLETIAKGASITFFGDFAGKGLGYLSQVVVARLLGVRFFGFYALGFTLYKFTSLIAQLGLNNGVLHFVPKLKGQSNNSTARGVIRSGLFLSFLFGSVLTVGIYLGSPWISSSIFNEPELTGVIRSFSIGIPFFSLMMVALYSTRSEKKMEYFVYVKNFQLQLSFLVIFLIAYLIGFRLYGATWAWVIATAGACLISLFFLQKVFPGLMNNFELRKIRKLLGFSLPLVLVGVLQFLILWTDTFMLGALSSAENVGLYRAAVQTALILGIFLRAFNSIFAPMISDLYHKGKKETLGFLFKTITRWIIILTSPIFVLILTAGGSLLKIFGPEFTVVWVPLAILGFAQLMDASMGPVGYILVMSGNQKIEFYNVLTVALLNIVLNYIMIPRFGMLGAALATGSSVIVVNLLRLFTVSRKLGLWPYDRRELLKLVTGFTIVVSVGFSWQVLRPNMHFLLYLITAFLLIAIANFGLFFLFGTNESDRMLLEVAKKAVLRVLW